MNALGGPASATVESALLERLISSLEVGIVLQDGGGELLASNAAAERILGLSRSQMEGLEPEPEGWSALHEDGWPLPREARPPQVALRSGRPVRDAVVGVKHPSGRVTWASITSLPLFRDGEERPYAVASSLADITEQRYAQAAERRIADRFRSLIEYSSDVITILDEQGREIYASPSVEKVLGYAPGEIAGSERFSLVHPDDLATVADALSRLTGHPGASTSYEYRVRAQDGSWRIVESIATNRLHDPAVLGIVVNTRDITERREATSRLAVLVENLQAGVVVEDENHNLAIANTDFCRIFGIEGDPDTLVGMDCRECASQAAQLVAEPETFVERVDQLLAASQTVRGEEIAFADGRTFERDYIPITVEGGATGHLWIFRDITHRKAAEQEAARVRDEAIRASRVKSEFLATMSHEIRTPMNGVIGTVELLLDSQLSDEQRELATVVRDSAYSLLGIINDVLDLSKIEAEKLAPKDVEFDLTGVVEGIGDVLFSEARRKDLWLTTYVDPQITMSLRGDPQWLRQVLLNLTGNAVKFTDEGDVRVRAELASLTDAAASVRFRVIDTGVGIPESARERLFEPFAQLDSTSTRRHSGTGLGLAICERLVRLMGGEIEVDSEPGRGSDFSFTLSFPRVGVDGVVRELPAGRVLLAEACDVTAGITRDYLTAWGMEVERVATGADALTLAGGAGAPFDVAIVGTSLPEDATEVASALRARNEGKRLTGVLLRDVAAPIEARAAAGRESPFAAEISKPVKQGRLFEAVAGASGSGAATHDGRRPRKRSLSGVHALVAEDNEVNRELLVRQLAKLGVEAEGVASGREAIRAVTAGHYDVVLMDCHMPEVDGFQATRMIRAAEHDGRTPIVAVTASAMVEDREACLAAGMDDCVTKPVTSAALESAIARCVASRGAVDDSVLERLADDLGGAEEVDRLLRMYLAHLPEAERTLVASAEDGDAEALARTVHRLRSASASFGARRLAELCADAERLARNGGIDDAAALVEDLRREAAAVREALEARV